MEKQLCCFRSWLLEYESYLSRFFSLENNSYNINPFKVYSVCFKYIYNHQHYKIYRYIPEHFYCSKRSPRPISSHCPFFSFPDSDNLIHFRLVGFSYSGYFIQCMTSVSRFLKLVECFKGYSIGRYVSIAFRFTEAYI